MFFKHYWHPNALSLAPLAGLENSGADYETILVKAEIGEHRTEACAHVEKG
jgi:hypothetical protein